MATLGHVAVGLVAGRLHAGPQARGRARWFPLIAYGTASLLPDLDVIGFRLGVPYADPWGHRGASHSLVFAAGIALVAGLAASSARLKTALLTFLAVGSHGLLDALTDGGLGPALFWPWTTRRFFAPFTPLPVAPIGARMLSLRGVSVLLHEAVFFLPLWLYGLWPRRAVRPAMLER